MYGDARKQMTRSSTLIQTSRTSTTTQQIDLYCNQEHAMTTTKSAHPLVLAAAVAVLLFCGVGTAALMGWLPSSHGDARPLDASTSSTQMATLQANQPPAGMQPLAALPQQPAQLPPQPQTQPQPQPEPQMAAAPAAPPPVCGNCGV